MIIRYIRAWIYKYILHIKSPSAYIAGWEYEWDLLTKGARDFLEVKANDK